MATDIENLHVDLVKCASRYGITVSEVDLANDVPGEFDGPTIKLNRNYDASERAFYLAHGASIAKERSKSLPSFEQLNKSGRGTKLDWNAQWASIFLSRTGPGNLPLGFWQITATSILRQRS